MIADERPNLYDLTLPEIERLMDAWGQPAYRARQLYRQMYVNLAGSPAAMTDLPAALREELAGATRMGALELVRLQTADQGSTRKALFRLPGGAVVESVLMVYPDRATACVSTQAGCAMGCVFCATARLGLLHNLSRGEIVEQVLWAARELRVLTNDQRPLPLSEAKGTTNHKGTRGQGDKETRRQDDLQSPILALSEANGSNLQSPTSRDTQHSTPNTQHSKLTNVVFMGMGEPFANYDRWWGSVERLHDPQGFNLGARNMTVSTVGLVPGIHRLAEEPLPINLAISLHAPDDALRSEMMPINRRYPIAALLDAARAYSAKTNRRVSFEYVLLQGKNDDPAQAAVLADLIRGMLCHVNLIPWNPVPGTPLGRSERARVLRFQQVLQEGGIPCTVRVERGIAIAAACGQLAGVPAAEPALIEAGASSQ